MFVSKRYHLLLYCMSLLGSFVGYIPYQYDIQRHYLHVSKSRRVVTLYKFNYLLLVIWFGFIGCQALRYKILGDLNSFSLCWAFLTGGSITLLVHGFNVFVPQEFASMVTALLNYLDFLSERHLKRGDRKTRKIFYAVDILSALLALGVMFMGLMLVFSFTLFPRLPILWGSVMPGVNAWKVRLVTFPFYVFTQSTIYGNFAYIGVIIVIQSLVWTPLLFKEFKVGKPSSYYQLTDEIRSDPFKLMKAFREIQVLHGFSMDVLGVILVPFEGLVIHLIGFAVYMGATQAHKLHVTTLAPVLSWAILLASFWAIVLALGGYAHQEGMRTIRSWKVRDWGSSYKKKLMGKFARSCRPLSVHWGSTFVVRRLTVFKFILTSSKVTARIMLTMRKNK